MNALHTVFVYGTLQRECSNHALLAGSISLGSARTDQHYVMRTAVDDSGRRGIPFVGQDLPISAINGEVYLVDDRTLAALDRLEGCVPDDPDASWYRREKVSVTLNLPVEHEGRYVDAFMYFREQPELPLVPSGRWLSAGPLEQPCWYFAFGSNMDPGQMSYRGVQFNRCLSGTLKGHRLVFNKRGGDRRLGKVGFANAMPDAGQDLKGILYQVAGRSMETLDMFEGARDGHYVRRQVDILVGGGAGVPSRTAKAWVYFAGEEYLEDGLRVSDRYMRHVRRGQYVLGMLEAAPNQGAPVP